ncbi:hypothetical protein DKT77_11885 [Meridianimarinicoccus roseus]|uniref:Uncharacterized protein n=1 Tax=Meridianimarinicoccus roseus TaxID=2072018 RepID=A0A2V2LFH3_9RHOB|nr:hypothetical protein [Meridianimarinicoccus roseus]PWR02254.1 hypothetical protein DKT77_11885 [Meridianimarinicoccus roseus]
MKHIVITLIAALFSTGVSAATLPASEASDPNGDFAGNPASAPVFSSDVRLVTGAQNKQNDIDFLTFDGFAEGTLSLDFVFTHPGGKNGKLDFLLQREAFKNKHSWPDHYHNPGHYTESISGLDGDSAHKVSYVLDGYTGPIHVALRFYDSDAFYGRDKRPLGVIYTAERVGAVMPAPAPSPAPVPLPAGLPLALAGIGALAALRTRSRAS